MKEEMQPRQTFNQHQPFQQKLMPCQLSLTQTFSNTGVKSKGFPFVYLLKPKLNGGRKRTLAKIHPENKIPQHVCQYLKQKIAYPQRETDSLHDKDVYQNIHLIYNSKSCLRPALFNARCPAQKPFHQHSMKAFFEANSK